MLVFAVNTWHRWSNPSTSEFDIFVDVDPQNGNGDDYVVVGVDQGAVQAGVFNGRMGAFVFSTRSAGSSLIFLATAPTDSSTALLTVLRTQLCRTGEPCLSSSNPRIRYETVAFDLTNDGVDPMSGTGSFNAFSSSITTGAFIPVNPGQTDTTDITVDPAEWALTPAKGAMVVVLDNESGKSETDLLEVKIK